MIQINKDGVSIYSEEQLLDKEPIEVQKNINLPEGRVKLEIAEDGSAKLVDNLNSVHSSCSLSTLLKSNIDKEVIIEFLLDKKEKYLKEQDQIQAILNKFKQSIPSNFLKLEIVKKNNWGSTEGLDKILCERYLFKQGEKQIWLDIPHSILEKVELSQGKNCS